MAAKIFRIRFHKTLEDVPGGSTHLANDNAGTARVEILRRLYDPK